MSQHPNTLDVLTRLAEVIESRKGGDPDKSYVARLFHKGTDTVLKKVGEEAVEAVMAGKDHAQQTTMKTHAPLPDRKNLEWVGEVISRFVKQAITDAPPKDDAQHP